MKNTLIFALAISILASCTTSNEVVSNKLFQKRKYQKGWHVNSTKKIDKTKESKIVKFEEKLVAKNEQKTNASSAPNKKEDTPKKATSNQKTENEAHSLLGSVLIEETEEAKEETKNSKETNSAVTTFEVQTRTIDPIEATKEAENNSSNSSGSSMLVMVLLCIFLPPVAVGLLRGWDSTEFIISLILFAVFWGGFALFGPLASLAGLAGIVYAFLILFDKL